MKQNTYIEASNHYYSIDCLRIVACILVVLTHICCYGMVDESLDIPISIFSVNDFQIYNFFTCLSQPAVAIFIMISGSFMLDPKINVTKEKISRHIIKCIKLIILFSIIGIILNLLFNLYFNNSEFMIKELLKYLDAGNGHLWYLYTILGLYLVTPILRKISSDTETLNKFIILSFVFSVLSETMSIFFPNNLFSSILDKLDLRILTGYILYYFLGYKLKELYEDNKLERKYVGYFLVVYIFSLLSTYFFSTYYRISNKIFDISPYCSNFYVATFLESISLFSISLLLNKSIKPKSIDMISKISSFTTGIYCFHNYVISYLFKLYDFNFCALIRIVLVTIIVLTISVFSTLCLRRISIFKDIV